MVLKAASGLLRHREMEARSGSVRRLKESAGHLWGKAHTKRLRIQQTAQQREH